MRFPDVLPYEKRKKSTVSKFPAIFPTCFSSQITVAHITIKILVFDEKNFLFYYQQLNFSAKMQWYATSDFDFIRENSTWIHLVVQSFSLVNLRIIFRILYFGRCTFKIEFSGQKLEFCVAVDRSDAKDPVCFCSWQKIGKQPKIVLCREKFSTPKLVHSRVHQHHHNCINKYFGMAHWRWSSKLHLGE